MNYQLDGLIVNGYKEIANGKLQHHLNIKFVEPNQFLTKVVLQVKTYNIQYMI
jgi:hypothetical protein